MVCDSTKIARHARKTLLGSAGPGLWTSAARFAGGADLRADRGSTAAAASWSMIRAASAGPASNSSVASMVPEDSVAIVRKTQAQLLEQGVLAEIILQALATDVDGLGVD